MERNGILWYSSSNWFLDHKNRCPWAHAEYIYFTTECSSFPPHPGLGYKLWLLEGPKSKNVLLANHRPSNSNCSVFRAGKIGLDTLQQMPWQKKVSPGFISCSDSWGYKMMPKPLLHSKKAPPQNPKEHFWIFRTSKSNNRSGRWGERCSSKVAFTCTHLGGGAGGLEERSAGLLNFAYSEFMNSKFSA